MLFRSADPAKETDADWNRRLSGKIQCLANGAKTLLDFVGGIEACNGCEIATVSKSAVHAPAPMKPKPPAPVTAAASSGVDANAIGAATIGLLMSAIGSVSINEDDERMPLLKSWLNFVVIGCVDMVRGEVGGGDGSRRKKPRN